MKKLFKSYVSIWAILLVLFNVIAFVSPGWIGYEKYTSSFWIGYIFITISFVGQLICAHFAFKANDLNKTFYNLSLIKTSFAGLVLSFVFGGITMLLTALPYWIGAILCAIVLAFSAVSVIKATIAIEAVVSVDEKVKAKTFFTKNIMVDAEGILARAKNEEAKAQIKKVCDAIRYSDPMSSDALSSVESQITIKLSGLLNAVSQENQADIKAGCDELLILIEDRNKKCKILK